MNRFYLVLLPLALVACSDVVTPKMIARAQLVCAPLGGLAELERYSDSGSIIKARCADGTQLTTPVTPVAPDSAANSATQAASSASAVVTGQK